MQKKLKRKKSVRGTKTQASEIVRLAEIVLRHFGQKHIHYGKRFRNKDILIIKEPSYVPPFSIILGVFTYARHQRKVALTARDKKITKIGYLPWTTKAVAALHALLPLEMLAEV
jgi:hypothetical protein